MKKNTQSERDDRMELIAITDDMHSIDELASKIIQIIDVVDYVHIREKSKKSIELFTLLNLLRVNDVAMHKIVLNDRLDVSILSGLSSIHLPGHGFPIPSVKEYFPHVRIGRSVHSLFEAKKAETENADYIVYGHCFETDCKKGIDPNGINQLIEIKKSLKLPIYAIGGITPDHVQLLKKIDVDGIAVMSGIFSSHDPLRSALQYYERCKISYEK